MWYPRVAPRTWIVLMTVGTVYVRGYFNLFQLNAENDRAISEHVLRGHRFRKLGSDMEPEQLNGTSAEGAGQQEPTESVEEATQVG